MLKEPEVQVPKKFRKSSLVLAVALAVTLLLSACKVATIAQRSTLLYSLGFWSIVMDDKMPYDYVAELATGLDCNSIRQYEDKGTYCRPPGGLRYYEPTVYCYRSLGNVECYSNEETGGTRKLVN